jgi:chromate reductase
MRDHPIQILGISGSLRSNSSATAVLNVVAGLMPARVNFTIFDGLGAIPAFNDSDNIPGPAENFIQLITNADAVFFCIPEYAFGVPGALKNALDWTVSSIAFPNKPVALITAASGGEKAHAAFIQILTALNTTFLKETTLLIPFIRSKLDEKNEVKDPAALDAIRNVVNSLINLIESALTEES